MQSSLPQRNNNSKPTVSTDDHQCFSPVTYSNHNWNPDSPHKHFSSAGLEFEKVTPPLPHQHSPTSSTSTALSSPSTTGRASVSVVFDNTLFKEQKPKPMTSTTVTTQSQQEDTSPVSDKASECDTYSSLSVTIQRTRSSPNFTRPTSSSRKKVEKINHPAPKPKEWKPSFTRPKSPNLRCVGKVSAFASTKEGGDQGNKCSTGASKSTKATSRNTKIPTPSAPKTPNVLRRKSMYTRRTPVLEEPNRAFVPNPTPRYLKTGNLPEIKQTRTTLKRKEARMNPERTLRQEAPKKVISHTPLDSTAVKPFELGSVVKHEEYVYQIQQRTMAEEEDDKKRREFHPVTLREEILHGPTFVPKRSETPLTTPVDLLPFAKERSERTRAFEARQRARMEEAERNTKTVAEEREKREEERLRMEYESKRFKSRPVPHSHYKPDIDPVEVADKRHSDDLASEPSPHRSENQSHTDNTGSGSEETGEIYEEVTDSVYNMANQTPCQTENKAVSILQGLRKSLSPLLGRGSTSLS